MDMPTQISTKRQKLMAENRRWGASSRPAPRARTGSPRWPARPLPPDCAKSPTHHVRSSGIVLDTNVLVAGLRSRRGASFRILSEVGGGKFDICVSVPLVLEYEEVLLRELDALRVDRQVVHAVLDYFCSVGLPQDIFFLWRPVLRDPEDEMVLEVAVAGQCSFVVTHNVRDFKDITKFGIKTITPKGFLQHLGELP